MKNLYLDRYRANRRRVGLAEQMASDLETSTGPVRNDVVLELVDQLPDAQRTVVEMRYIQGLNSREIGVKLGIPAATVRSRLHQALKRLRKYNAEELILLQKIKRKIKWKSMMEEKAK